MTYISRGTRITLSRWLDECDAEYRLRAVRKRSDGRLKRLGSCDDLRAWSICECTNYEYLLDLMSDGESTGKSRVHLYGRYVPVPLLIKLIQGLNEGIIEGGLEKNVTADDKVAKKPEGEKTGKKKNVTTDLNSGSNKNKSNKDGKEIDIDNCGSEQKRQKKQKWEDDEYDKGERWCRFDLEEGLDDANESHEEGDDLWKTQYEKYLLEKRLFECRSLLCKAVGKLEKIDGIVCDGNYENENLKNEEIETSFRQNKSSCNCNENMSHSFSSSPSRANLKKIRDVARCTEVLRKISDLKQKLKVIRERRQEVNEQIRMQRIDNCSNQQVTELYSRRDELKLKKLQKKLERLVAKKGQLLLELADAINSLNKLKKSIMKSKSRSSCTSKGSLGDEEFRYDIPVACACGCQCTENFDSSNSPASEDLSQDDYTLSMRNMQSGYSFSTRKEFSCKNLEKCAERNSIRGCNGSNQGSIRNERGCQSRTNINKNKNSDNSNLNKSYGSNYNFNPNNCSTNNSNHSNRTYKISTADSNNLESSSSRGREQTRPLDEDVEGKPKAEKRSKLKFVCPESACKKRSLSENLDNFKNVFVADQVAQDHARPFSNVANPRPYTSPSVTGSNVKSEIPERKIKSETTMEEIEKTLRNYEQRLRCLETLECKIIKMKQRVVEGNRQREEWLRQKAESKKIREAEREQSNKEMSKLCSENWALKKKVRELMEKSDSQLKKIECLKASKKKLKEVECETEELHKELSKYQDSFEGQQKRICMLENYVVNQRTEIEKLTNMVNKLNAVPAKCFQDKSVQRSRSYSPESVNTTGMYGRMNNQPCQKQSQSSDDDEGWCCEERRQQEMRSQQRISGTTCCSPHGIRRKGRCVN